MDSGRRSSRSIIRSINSRSFGGALLGIKDPKTGQVFGLKTKVLSSIPLWSGKGTPDKCQCLEGPGHVKEPITVLKREQRLRIEAREKINYFIFALCLSCNP